MFCGCFFFFVGLGLSMTMFLSVGSASFMSCLFAPATATARGIPFPSTRMLLFVPDLDLSVGFGPVLGILSEGGRYGKHDPPKPIFQTKDASIPSREGKKRGEKPEYLG